MRARRSALTVGVVVTATAMLPLGLAACSAVDHSAQAAELRAAEDSNLLSLPSDRVYEVSGVEIVEPSGASAFSSAIDSEVDASGHFVLNDGIITEAELNVDMANAAHASFVLSEPTVLRDKLGEEGAVIANGVLTVNGVAQQHTRVELVPADLNEDHAEFDVSFAMPDNPMMDGTSFPFDQVTVHLALDSR